MVGRACGMKTESSGTRPAQTRKVVINIRMMKKRTTEKRSSQHGSKHKEVTSRRKRHAKNLGFNRYINEKRNRAVVVKF